MNEEVLGHVEERDDVGAKMGMWIFIFTEILLFTGLFLVYSVYRTKYHDDFHIAGYQLNVFIGTINTIILLVSSGFIAMAVTAIQKAHYKAAFYFTLLTILFALMFLVNKYFEWGHEIEHKIYTGSDFVKTLKYGELLFFSLYFLMTGLHGLHVIAGMTLLTVVLIKIKKHKINPDKYMLLENGALYWHMVDIIWIFLFPLLYLIT